jgi:hypothetical protein
MARFFHGLIKLNPDIMKTRSILTCILLVTGVFVFSCKKDTGSAPIKILLTDNPAAYDSVNIQIVGMEVKLSKDSESWIPINVNDSTYNLLELQNGITKVLAQDTIPTGVLREVRFILGNDSYVVVNGTYYPLETPSAEESGLKVKIDKVLNETLNSFVLDFDAAASVMEENGSYKLHPVIRLVQ